MIYPHEGLTAYWYLALPDYEELTFLNGFLSSDDVFYDVGSNAGAFSIFAAGCGAQVVAFEPVPDTFRRLQENIKLNSQATVTAINRAVGSTPGTLRITTGFGTGNHALRSDESVPSVEVKVVSLNEIVRDHSMPTFLKVDVEGFELEVLKGARMLLESQELQGILLETFRPHNWKNKRLQEIERLLLSHGFSPYAYDVYRNDLVPLNKPDAGENNTFYFRSPDAIVARLRGNLKIIDDPFQDESR